MVWAQIVCRTTSCEGTLASGTRLPKHNGCFCETEVNNSIKVKKFAWGVRDKLGGRPYDVIKDAGKYTLRFFPQTANAKNPDTVLFRVTLTKDDLKKLCKLSG